MEFKLPKKVKNIWLKALRSGKYEQGKNNLKYKEYDENFFRYCCLGVARECGLTRARARANNTNEWVCKNFLPKEVQNELADMNDHGSMFKEIAKWIEKNL